MKFFAKIEEIFLPKGATVSYQRPSVWGTSFDFDPTNKTVSDLKKVLNEAVGHDPKVHQIVTDSAVVKGKETKESDVVTHANLKGPIVYKVTWQKK